MADITTAAVADSPAPCATTPNESASSPPASAKGTPSRTPRVKAARALVCSVLKSGGAQRRRARLTLVQEGAHANHLAVLHARDVEDGDLADVDPAVVTA